MEDSHMDMVLVGGIFLPIIVYFVIHYSRILMQRVRRHGVDEEIIIHDIEAPPPPPQAVHQHQQRQKAGRVESYRVFSYQKDAEAVGFHSGECVICLGEFEKEDECVMLKKCKHTYHLECIDKVEENSCPVCRHSIDMKSEKGK